MSDAAARYRPVSPARVLAMVRRHFYLMRSSWPRLAELIYWPLVQMLMWGFLQTYLNANSTFLAAAGASGVAVTSGPMTL